MLASPGIIAAVASSIQGYGSLVVLDPVMVAKLENSPLAAEGEAALIKKLRPPADVLTSNLPEAARLLGRDQAQSAEETDAQSRALLKLGARAEVMKSRYAEGPTCVDRLITASGVLATEQPRLAARNTRGTGYSRFSAIAAGPAKGAGAEDAVRRAQAWLHGAICVADGLGSGGGYGSAHHFHEIWT